MNDEQALEWAAASGFLSASLLYIYNGKKEALSRTELDELEAIKHFAKLVRNAALNAAINACKEYAEIPKVDSGVPLAIANRIGLLK
jgi:hypothetical protein